MNKSIKDMNADEKKAAIKAELVALKKVNNDNVIILAAKYDTKEASVRSIAVRSEEVEYTKLAKVSKNGKAVTSKSDLVAKIEAATGKTFTGLDKANKTDLESLVEFFETVDICDGCGDADEEETEETEE